MDVFGKGLIDLEINYGTEVSAPLVGQALQMKKAKFLEQLPPDKKQAASGLLDQSDTCIEVQFNSGYGERKPVELKSKWGAQSTVFVTYGSPVVSKGNSRFLSLSHTWGTEQGKPKLFPTHPPSPLSLRPTRSPRVSGVCGGWSPPSGLFARRGAHSANWL